MDRDMSAAPGRRHKPHKLVLCFDGTGNTFNGNDSDSNILKIYRMLDRTADDQYHYYQPGIGTYIVSRSLSHTSLSSRLRSWYMKAKDSAVGSSFDQHVVGGYRFLMRFYSPGDEIYIFGFSRGAYIARFLAEMLDHVGLLSHGNEEMVSFAWKAFSQWQCRRDTGGDDVEGQRKKRQMYEFMKGFRETFSRPVRRIQFLGLFDTVNSVPRFETAWMERSKFPYTARSSAKVIRHAVSIDERRAKFRQDLIYQSEEVRVKRKQHHNEHHLDGMGQMMHNMHTKYRYRPRLDATNGKPSVAEKEHRGRRPSQLDQLGLPQPDQPEEQAPYRAPSRSKSRATHRTADDGASNISRVGPSTDNGNEDFEAEDEAQQDIDEVWFAGGHGDVGGGWEVEPHTKSTSHVPLVWMVREAMRAGLRFDMQKVVAMGCSEVLEETPDSRTQEPVTVPDILIEPASQPCSPDMEKGHQLHSSDANPVVTTNGGPQPTSFHELMHKAHLARTHDCLSFDCGMSLASVLAWKMMEYLPFRRMDLRSDGSWKPIRWPLPWGEVRDIPSDVRVHGSVIRRMQMDETYRPGNLIVGGGGRGCRIAPEGYGMGAIVGTLLASLAIGLASAIVQFVDFSSKLLSGAREIYSSASGASAEHDGADLAIDTLGYLTRRLPSVITPRHAMTSDDEMLLKLKAGCEGVSDELKKILEAGRAKTPGSKCDDVSEIKKALTSLIKESPRYAESIRKDLDRTQTSIIDTVQAELQFLGSQNKQHSKEDKQQTSLEQIQKDLSHLLETMEIIPAQDAVLDMLWFDTITTRQRSVDPAHRDTFRWLLHEEESSEEDHEEEQSYSDSSSGHETEDSESDSYHRELRKQAVEREEREAFKRCVQREAFLKWLRSGRGVFYISGKAGAGKSTLMKFLSQEEKTRQELQAWAESDGKQLILACFFFWNSGDQLQKSLEGLYRAMLWDILRQFPALIPHAFPDTWSVAINAKHRNIRHDPSFHIELKDLRAALDRIFNSQIIATQYKLCIFIDGLDEFHGQGGQEGDYWTLSKAISSWSTSDTNIKFCVSSRPYNEFMKIFASDPSRHLRLHDLTRKDMFSFVRSEFQGDERSAAIRAQRKYYSSLIRKIVDRSDGIFLWVRLVTYEMLKAMGNHSSPAQLDQRLYNIPKGLGGIFKRIFDDIDGSERKRAAQMLLVMKLEVEFTMPNRWVATYWVMEKMMDNQSMSRMTPIILDVFEMEHLGLSVIIDSILDAENGAECNGLPPFVEEMKSLIQTCGPVGHDPTQTYT
ncbi:hypothetical protein VMCG_09737 [Cytospora schulzeri]|uniref:DUF2235 domain-containing protein n=1 Tax=Cytospora schulzeri TaxID=448051 RepID=A0A423VHF3_9PEZI|nr:hypothetical protein VMCG_09737 [Valsa malicola]